MQTKNKISTLDERMDEIMFDKNLSPEDVRKAVNVDLALVYRWLRNEYTPTFENLVKLANFFNCSIDFLVGISDNDKQKDFKNCPPFGERLRFILKKENKTEYRIAKDTKISRKSFNDWFKNTSLPYLDNLIKLASYLNCTIDYLVGRED